MKKRYSPDIVVQPLTPASVVNASGFLLQLALTHSIAATRNEHGWEVLSQEHPWIGGDGRNGYADLLLSSDTLRMVVECKRRRDATWFFIPSAGSDPVRRARLAWAAYSPEKPPPRFGWHDFALDPQSPEAMFCATRGTGEDDSNVLERLCHHLLRALDAIVAEELLLFQKGNRRRVAVYLPVVTNVELRVCHIDVSQVSLTTGMLQQVEAEPVPMVRFRKSLATTLTQGASPRSFAESAQDKERTVLVLNSSSIPSILKGWKVRELDDFDDLPWNLLHRAP